VIETNAHLPWAFTLSQPRSRFSGTRPGNRARTGTFKHFRGDEPPQFAHPSELELAKLLDASGIPWEYEPHTFPLDHDADGNVVEAFTPDFFLPEAGMYVECRTTKRSLMSRKRRKVRKARRLHGLTVTLHERHDFERLLRRYGR
jgi:hypoxanthine phosphoribosyltransferase